jgi:NADH-quinone oxidoreductase subunit N
MNDAYTTFDTLRLLMPELLLVGLAVWMYLAAALFGTQRATLHTVAVWGLLVVAAALYGQQGLPDLAAPLGVGALHGPLIVDTFSEILRWGGLSVGLLLVLAAGRGTADGLAGEYLGSLLLVVAGMMLVATADDLALLFVGLELISIPTYVLLFLGGSAESCYEATAKYFFLSILASALLLFGLSFLYGVTGTISISRMPSGLMASSLEPSAVVVLVPLAMLLVAAGLGFKMAAVPFHFYAPDVYQGTSNANAGLLAVAPKIAGLVVLIRLVIATFPHVGPVMWQASLLIAIVSMTLGNVVALWQKNIRRLLAYSSIAHAGYLFLGMTVATALPAGPLRGEALAATLFYLLVYVLATLGSFAALTYLGRETRQVDDVEQLSGLGMSHPAIAVALAVCLLSLTGIPPLAGFWGKLLLFANALAVASADAGAGLGVRPWLIGLAVVGAVNAAISAGYYLRVIAAMYFRETTAPLAAAGGRGAWLTTVMTAALVVAIGLAPGRWVAEAQRAAEAAWRGVVPIDRGGAQCRDRGR